jgi:hypothetical protein
MRYRSPNGADAYFKELVETKPGLKRFWSEYQHAFDDPFRSHVTNEFAKKTSLETPQAEHRPRIRTERPELAAGRVRPFGGPDWHYRAELALSIHALRERPAKGNWARAMSIKSKSRLTSFGF